MTSTEIVVPPRGRLIGATSIVQRWYLDAETGKPFVNVRWVSENMPYKQRLSRSRVGWYEKDVEAIIVEARRAGILVKDVKLAYLETKSQ